MLSRILLMLQSGVWGLLKTFLLGPLVFFLPGVLRYPVLAKSLVEGGIIPECRQHRIRHRLKSGTADYNPGYVDTTQRAGLPGLLVFWSSDRVTTTQALHMNPRSLSPHLQTLRILPSAKHLP